MITNRKSTGWPQWNVSLLGALLRGCLAPILPILQNSAQAHMLTGASLMFNPLLCLVCVSHSALSVRPHALVAPGSSVHGVLQARILAWVAILFSRDLPNPGIKPRSPALRADSLPFFTRATKEAHSVCWRKLALVNSNRILFIHYKLC